jgi:hypothetical protein
MCDPKYPARQIVLRPIRLEMSEKSQEDFLNHIFGIVWFKAKRYGISQKTYTKKAVKIQNLIFRRPRARSIV